MEWLTRLLKSTEPQHMIAGVAAAMVIVDTFFKPLTAVSLGLIALALSPWIAKYIKKAKLPGGTEIEFREAFNRVTKDAEEAGLLVEPTDEQEQRSEYQVLFDEDPTLGLAKLRIELERILVGLAEAAHIDRKRRRGIKWLAYELGENEILNRDELAVIGDIIPLLNAAIHSEDYSYPVAQWVSEEGPKLIAALDNKLLAQRRPPA